MSASKPFNRSITCQAVFENPSVERCRSLSVNRRSSEGAESKCSRSNSRMILVMPAEQKSQISLPRSSTDSAIMDVQRKESDLSDSADEEEDVRLTPLVHLNRAPVLPFMFLGERETVQDTPFLCANKIWSIANLTSEKIEHLRLSCCCDSRSTTSHVIQEHHIPIEQDMTLQDYHSLFKEFNSVVTKIRGTDRKILVYSETTQLGLMFVTQFIMSHYKNVELKRAQHQLEKNLRGCVELPPRYINILEEYEEVLLAKKAVMERTTKNPVLESRASSSSSTGISSAGSTPKKEARVRNGSLSRTPKIAWP